MSREAMKVALDALENLDGTEFPEQTKAIAALRAALAEQPTMNERIRADMTASRESFYKRADELLDERIAAAKLAALAEQPAPVVLTDAEIRSVFKDKCDISEGHGDAAIATVRAILAAAIPPGYCVVKDEPVGWYFSDVGRVEFSRIQRVGWTPLYAARPGAPK